MTKLHELQNNEIDLGVWLQLFAFGKDFTSPARHTRTNPSNVIGEVTFSRRFGFMDAQNDGGTLQRNKQALRSGSWIGQVPWLYWLHDLVMPVVGNLLAINVRHGRMRYVAVREIQTRNNRRSDHQDILSKLFDVQRDKPQEFSEADVA